MLINSIKLNQIQIIILWERSEQGRRQKFDSRADIQKKFTQQKLFKN